MHVYGMMHAERTRAGDSVFLISYPVIISNLVPRYGNYRGGTLSRRRDRCLDGNERHSSFPHVNPPASPLISQHALLLNPTTVNVATTRGWYCSPSPSGFPLPTLILPRTLAACEPCANDKLSATLPQRSHAHPTPAASQASARLIHAVLEARPSLPRGYRTQPHQSKRTQVYAKSIQSSYVPARCCGRKFRSLNRDL